MDYFTNYAKRWTEADHEILRENYPKWGKKKCAELLGRTEASVKARAKQLRVFNRIVEPWNDEDTRRLIELYPNTDTDRVAEILGTTKKRVWQRAGYLGISKTKEFMKTKQHKKKPNAWTDEELKILREMYSDNPTKDIPIKRTAVAINLKANLLGLKKSERIINQFRRQFREKS